MGRALAHLDAGQAGDAQFLHSDGAQDSFALRAADLSVALLRDGRDG